MNYSKQREIILNALRDNVVHPTAEYLYDKLKWEHTTLSLATVYRNLNQLAQKGLIKKIEGLSNSIHYDHNTHAHYHFICDKCKRVYDISCKVAPNIEDAAEQETNFVINGHELTFHGLCKDCK